MENSDTSPQPAATQDKRNLVLTVYILQAVGVLIGITALVGVIINYVKRKDVAGSYLASHFDWQIKTFWATFLGTLLGVLLMPVGIGPLVLLVVSVWYIYRVVKGWLVFNDGRSIGSGWV